MPNGVDKQVSEQAKREIDHHAQQNYRAECLQWFALGVIAGSIEQRDNVEPEDFIGPDMQAAVDSLKKKTGAFHSLSKLMQELGVTWKKSDANPPVDAAFEVLKLDAKRHRVMTLHIQGLEKIQFSTIPENTIQFLEYAVEAGRQAE
jgi:transposase